MAIAGCSVAIGALWEVDRCTGIDPDNDMFYEEIEVNLTGP
jgi:hypothetical protein